MLLTRLAEHAAHRSDLPPPYYRNRAVRWVINIRSDGTPAAPELQDQAGSDQPAGQPLPAPYVYRSGQRPPAALLVDTLQYVLAVHASRRRATTGRKPSDATATMPPCWHAGVTAPQEMRWPAPWLAFFDAGHHLRIKMPGRRQAGRPGGRHGGGRVGTPARVGHLVAGPASSGSGRAQPPEPASAWYAGSRHRCWTRSRRRSSPGPSPPAAGGAATPSWSRSTSPPRAGAARSSWPAPRYATGAARPP